MKYFFDTEFMEDGKTIEPISIGIINEDNETFYAEWSDIDYTKANMFVLEHVIPNLELWDIAINSGSIEDFYINKEDNNVRVYGDRELIKTELLKWIGNDQPSFYAWYASYDWVMLCQLFGTMIDLPDNWPMFVNDVKPIFDDKGYSESWLNINHPDPTDAHNALTDAIWLKNLYSDII